MKYLFLAFFYVFCSLGFGQIVQPGQLEIVVYPGAQIDNIEDLESKTESKKEVNLFDYYILGNICFNKNQCYDSLRFNVDVLNRNVVLKKDNDELAYLSFSFLYSLYNINDKSNFQLIKAESDDKPLLSKILFENDNVVLYKKYFVKTLQANYRPEFDTGSKEQTYELDFTYEFIDELGNQVSLRKINKRILKKSLYPKSAVYTEHIKSNKVKDTKDFIDALKKTY